MSSEYVALPEDDEQGDASQQENTSSNKDGIETSVPSDKGPVGPFEHSGETAGWTKVEEKLEQEASHQADNDNKAGGGQH